MNHGSCQVSCVLIVVLLAVVADGETALNNGVVRTEIYRGVPLPLYLIPNEETRIHLEESVEVGLPPLLSSKLLASSVHGIVFLTAMQAFTRQRLVLKGNQTGRFVLLDVAATSDGAPVNDIYVQTSSLDDTLDLPSSLTPVQLLRYIAGMTLAPQQPRSVPSQIRRTSVALHPDTIYRNVEVASTLLAAWRSDEWLALTIELRNQGGYAIRLSPDDVDGVWDAAAFTHARLLSRGKRGAQTVMFLVGAHDAIAELQQ